MAAHKHIRHQLVYIVLIYTKNKVKERHIAEMLRVSMLLARSVSDGIPARGQIISDGLTP